VDFGTLHIESELQPKDVSLEVSLHNVYNILFSIIITQTISSLDFVLLERKLKCKICALTLTISVK
jgi:hypothetical protein